MTSQDSLFSRPRSLGSIAEALTPAPYKPLLLAGENQKDTLDSLCDTFRINFYKEYIGNATEAVLENGVDLQVGICKLSRPCPCSTVISSGLLAAAALNGWDAAPHACQGAW